MSKKCSCGKELTAEEIHYYGGSCNECEGKYSEQLSAELTGPCLFLQAEGDMDKFVSSLRTKYRKRIDQR